MLRDWTVIEGSCSSLRSLAVSCVATAVDCCVAWVLAISCCRRQAPCAHCPNDRSCERASHFRNVRPPAAPGEGKQENDRRCWKTARICCKRPTRACCYTLGFGRREVLDSAGAVPVALGSIDRFVSIDVLSRRPCHPPRPPSRTEPPSPREARLACSPARSIGGFGICANVWRRMHPRKRRVPVLRSSLGLRSSGFECLKQLRTPPPSLSLRSQAATLYLVWFGAGTERSKESGQVA
eukprot:15433133-Alexandrium_andersonii.AAC.1